MANRPTLWPKFTVWLDCSATTGTGTVFIMSMLFSVHMDGQLVALLFFSVCGLRLGMGLGLAKGLGGD